MRGISIIILIILAVATFLPAFYAIDAAWGQETAISSLDVCSHGTSGIASYQDIPYVHQSGLYPTNYGFTLLTLIDERKIQLPSLSLVIEHPPQV